MIQNQQDAQRSYLQALTGKVPIYFRGRGEQKAEDFSECPKQNLETPGLCSAPKVPSPTQALPSNPME